MIVAASVSSARPSVVRSPGGHRRFTARLLLLIAWLSSYVRRLIRQLVSNSLPQAWRMNDAAKCETFAFGDTIAGAIIAGFCLAVAALFAVDLLA